MIIGVPKEIKNNENRVGITPAGVTAIKNNGHEVQIESGAGLGSGLPIKIMKRQAPKLYLQRKKHGLRRWL